MEDNAEGGGTRVSLGTPAHVERSRASWMDGVVTVNGRSVPRVSTQLTRADRWGGWKVRWNVGRDSYAVLPGLYAAGSPTADSPVLVSANYKLSFDALRASLKGIDSWILVLDTKGVNVWCAAGKGTFGTAELVRRLTAVRLDQVVSHRSLVLPQLSASGVSAPEVKRSSGWSVRYGPVRAEDLPAWFSAGQRKTEQMREVRFRLSERLAVAPVELTQAWPFLLAMTAGSALLALPVSPDYLGRLLVVFLPLVGGVLVAAFAFPALLPWLPFRAFALKGAVLGAAWGAACWLVTGASAAAGAGLTLVIGAVVSFITMNFTGSSTFTSQTGAALEVRRGLAPMAACFIVGIGLSAAARIFSL